MTLWAVMFKRHIHKEYNGKLAVFKTKGEARDWIDLEGIPGLEIRKLKIVK